MSKEKWKIIKGYEKAYEVSNLGRVRSFKGNGRKRSLTPKILRQTKNGWGYPCVHLCLRGIKGKNKYIRVHRLVAEYFLPPIKNKPHVNHKDGNKLNNHIGNLEWCTASENMLHSYDKGLRSTHMDTHHMGKLTSHQVLRIRRIIKNHPGITKAKLARIFKVSPQAINHIVKGKNWRLTKIL